MPDRWPYLEEEALEWFRPDSKIDHNTSSLKTPFLVDDASSNEVLQGKLANCWFISALSVLATRDELIRGDGEWAMSQKMNKIDFWTSEMCSKGVYPPIFHKFRRKKIYVMRFFKEFKWRYVVIDDNLPHTYEELLYARCTSEKELWVPLIEKAYAKLFGCYEALETGNIDDAIVDMTGYVCERFQLHDKHDDFSHEKESFWSYMTKQT